MSNDHILSREKLRERRSGKDRRQGPNDRRDMIRFEPDAEPRRSGIDRRKERRRWEEDRKRDT